MAEKNKITKENNPYEWHKGRALLFTILKWVCTIAPLVIMFIIYLVSESIAKKGQVSVIRFSLGSIMAIVLLILLIIGESKKQDQDSKDKPNNLSLHSVFVWLLLSGVFLFINMSMAYLTTLCFVETIGQIFASVFSMLAINHRIYANEERQADTNAKAMKRNNVGIKEDIEAVD